MVDNNLVSEMADERLQHLEQQVASLSVGQERMLKQMNDFFQGMQGRDEASASNQRGPRQGGLGVASSGSFHMKAVRLEFPCYDGSEDPTIWLYRAKQYFEFQSTGEDEKVKLASYPWKGMPRFGFKGRNCLKHTWNGRNSNLS